LARAARKTTIIATDEGTAGFTGTTKIRYVFDPFALYDLEEVGDIAMSEVAIGLEAEGKRIAQSQVG